MFSFLYSADFSSLLAISSVGFKVNVDATTNISEGCFGVGVVIRNSMGLIIFAAAFFYPMIFRVEVFEAKTILVGILCAGKKCLKPFCVESDALSVVQLCYGVDVSRAEIDLIVQDISVFKARYGTSFIGYMHRSCNIVVHSLAKRAVICKVFSCWEAPFPAWLSKLVAVDSVFYSFSGGS
ncbi:hypothetical protein ACOSP7_006758 [Xanthoceras sorbifolium]